MHTDTDSQQQSPGAGAPSGDMVYLALGSLTDVSWYTTQRLGTTMANRYRVLYVDLPATINEVLQGRKSWSNLTTLAQPRGDNLYWHCPPYPVPFGRRARPLQATNEAIARVRLAAAVRRLRFQRPIVWLDNPFRQDCIASCNPSLVVYHCLHDFDKLPYELNIRYTGPQWSAKNVAVEERLLRRADLVLTPSQARLPRFGELNDNSHLFHMGVDVESHRQAREGHVSLPDIDAIPSPRIGFLGTVGRKKIDFDMIVQATFASPDWSFVFVGRTFNVGVANQPPPQHPRLFYLDEKPHAQVPGYLTRFDVSIIPYYFDKIPDLTLKFFEYMATGKPLVVPDLPQFREYVPLVYLYRDTDGFVEALRAALQESDLALAERRRALAADHSFERQVDRAAELIAETWARKTEAAR